MQHIDDLATLVENNEELQDALALEARDRGRERVREIGRES